MNRNSMISQLRCVLPYPLEWYERMNDKQLKGIYYKHLPKIAMLSIQRDEDEVRFKQGLPSIERHKQLTLF